VPLALALSLMLLNLVQIVDVISFLWYSQIAYASLAIWQIVWEW